jgi:hypothetical protein
VGRSWGHVLRPFSEEELAYRDHWTIRWVEAHGALPERPDYGPEGRRLCSATGRCCDPARWWGSYRYVTGKAGRVGTARRPLCDAHAEGWRRRYGARDLEQPGRPVNATERGFAELLERKADHHGHQQRGCG